MQKTQKINKLSFDTKLKIVLTRLEIKDPLNKEILRYYWCQNED